MRERILIVRIAFRCSALIGVTREIEGVSCKKKGVVVLDKGFLQTENKNEKKEMRAETDHSYE